MIKQASVLNFGSGSLAMNSSFEKTSNTGVLQIKEIPGIGVGNELVAPPDFFDDSEIELRFSNLESIDVFLKKLNDVRSKMVEDHVRKIEFLNSQVALFKRIKESTSYVFDIKALYDLLYARAFHGLDYHIFLNISDLQEGILYICADDVFAGFKSGDQFVFVGGENSHAAPLQNFSNLKFIDSCMQIREKRLPVHVRVKKEQK